MNTEATTPQTDISVTFRHTDSTDSLRDYAQQKVENALDKYVISDASARVVLSVEKRDHQAEVRVQSKRFEIEANAITGDLYSAIDKMIDNMTTQLRRQKEKTTEHKSLPVRDAFPG